MRVGVVGAAAVRDIPHASPDRALEKTRKMMSRGAYLAARCLGDLMRDAAWSRTECGYFLGVGASGGSLDDVTALLAASIVDGTFSVQRFGDAGLGACNPLLAFQLMNNFTLCHGAILEGLGGPNSALFSRGAGTTAALIEAAHAVASGDCEHAIAGGADSALHPVTRADLARDGFLDRGLVPTEGAAMLALGSGPALAYITDCAVGRSLDDALVRVGQPDLVVAAGWGPPATAEVLEWTTRHAPRARWLDAADGGDALAASPALAWVRALDDKQWERALVINAGVDGDFGAVVFERGAA